MLSAAEGALSCIPDSRPTVAGWQGPGQRPAGEGDVEPWLWVPGSCSSAGAGEAGFLMCVPKWEQTLAMLSPGMGLEKGNLGPDLGLGAPPRPGTASWGSAARTRSAFLPLLPGHL